ncbi:MAG TPA: ABC transporter substrate-binding protein [bacterium]|nr:ABC transporter substrate-binding protein [bacterium]
MGGRNHTSRREFLKLVGVGTAGTLLLPPPAAAASPVPVSGPRMRAPEPNPKRGGTLRNAFGVTTAHFDVHQGANAFVLCHMYNGLVTYNLGDGIKTVVPDLAARWTISPDGRTYTFLLREGVKFHDGTPLSSADVLASYQRIISPPQGIVSENKGLFTVVDRIDAPDPKTFRVVLKEPRVYFLELLAQPAMVIYSKKSLDENQGDLRKVIAPGTGPFVFKEHKQAEKWTFVRNPNYWDPDLPYLDSLELVHVPAWTDRGTAVLTGQADMSWNVSIETFAEGEKRKDIVSGKKLYNFGAYAVLFNCRKKPFDDARVRRAIHLAVSRQDLIKAFQTQEPIDNTRWVPHGDTYALPTAEILKLPGYRADKSADIPTAKKLLAEAGYGDGIKGVDLLVASVAPHSEILAPAFQEQLKRTLNIEAKIRVAERAVLVQEQAAGNYGVVIDTPGHLLSDIVPLAADYFKTGGSRNWAGFSDPRFDRLLAQVDSETNPTARAKLIREMEDLLDQEPPWVMIGYTFHLPMWRNKTKGLALDRRVRALWGRLDTAWEEP